MLIVNKIYSQHNEKLPELHELPGIVQYVLQPDSTDYLCHYEIELAKRDIEQGKVLFGHLLGSVIRYEEEIQELCEQYGMTFDYVLFDGIITTLQKEPCYLAYMDKFIIEKFGLNFKETLSKSADSLYVARVILEDKIVQYWDCDEMPRLPGESRRTQELNTDTLISFPPVHRDSINEYMFSWWPYFDIGFIVEKDSTISNIYARGFAPFSEENIPCEEELYRIAVAYLTSKYPTWIPGKLEGVPVRTDNNVRIFLKGKE